MSMSVVTEFWVRLNEQLPASEKSGADRTFDRTFEGV
jgi:hypothetical protein